MAALRIRLGENVSFRTRCLLFPNPNMMLPPLFEAPQRDATIYKVAAIAKEAVMVNTVRDEVGSRESGTRSRESDIPLSTPDS